MTFEGRIENGKVVLDEPVPLEEGTRVRIEVAMVPSQVHADDHAPLPTIAEQLASVIAKAEGLPTDWSENHDKYLREQYAR